MWRLKSQSFGSTRKLTRDSSSSGFCGSQISRSNRTINLKYRFTGSGDIYLRVRFRPAFDSLGKRLQQSASVNHGRYEYTFGLYAINDPVAVDKPLANCTVSELRNSSPNLRKIRNRLSRFDDS